MVDASTLSIHFISRIIFNKWYMEMHVILMQHFLACIKTIMFPGSKVRLVRRADNLTAISEPIV
jgi:hypothetical protein